MRAGQSAGTGFIGRQNAAIVVVLLIPTAQLLHRSIDVVSSNAVPWCITLDNSKGISRLRFWAKNRRVNGINDLPVFMGQVLIFLSNLRTVPRARLSC